MCVCLICLALSAALHIVDDELFIRSPVVMFNKGKSV